MQTNISNTKDRFSKDFSDGFGKRLQYIRKKNKLTQQELANLVSISREAIGNYENGKRTRVPYDVVSKLAENLGTTSTFLYGTSDDPRPLTVITVEQFMAEYLISRPTADKLIHSPGFPMFRIGRVIRIYKDLLPEYFEKITNV